jgi:hypothetical protein
VHNGQGISSWRGTYLSTGTTLRFYLYMRETAAAMRWDSGEFQVVSETARWEGEGQCGGGEREREGQDEGD